MVMALNERSEGFFEDFSENIFEEGLQIKKALPNFATPKRKRAWWNW